MQHPNIIEYIGTKLLEEGRRGAGILLEYVPGGTIRALIDQFGPLEETVCRVYLVQLVKAVEYLHNKHILH